MVPSVVAPADLIVRGRVLTPTGVSAASVLVRAGRIVGLAPLEGAAGAARVIDAGEGWVAPGFIDMQINGGLGHDFGHCPAGVGAVAAWLPRTGVTAFLPTVITAPLPRLHAALEGLAVALSEPSVGAVPLGVHLEGPFLNPAYRGAHALVWVRPPDLDEMAALCAAGPVRLVTLAPELPGALALVEWLRARGIVASAGHSAATIEQAHAAFAAGVTAGTHLFNAMAPMHHRAPGLAGALLTTPEPVVAGLIADGIHVHPAMVRLAVAARGAGGLALVSDAVAGLGMASGEHLLGGEPIVVREGVARRVDGTIAGSVTPLDAAVRVLVAAGVQPAEALRMAAQTPATVLGLTDRGRISTGARADLVVLDADLHVRQTIIGGRVAWSAP